MRTWSNLLLTAFSATLLGSATAEMKSLVCETKAPITWLKDAVARWDSSCAKDGGNACKLAEKFKPGIARCESGQVDYTERITLTLDTSALSGNTNSLAEGFRESCQAVESGPLRVQRYRVEATPSTILFSKDDAKERFSVNRQSLTGGYDGKSDYQCHIEAVDASKNKI